MLGQGRNNFTDRNAADASCELVGGFFVKRTENMEGKCLWKSKNQIEATGSLSAKSNSEGRGELVVPFFGERWRGCREG